MYQYAGSRLATLEVAGCLGLTDGEVTADWTRASSRAPALRLGRCGSIQLAKDCRALSMVAKHDEHNRVSGRSKGGGTKRSGTKGEELTSRRSR